MSVTCRIVCAVFLNKAECAQTVSESAEAQRCLNDTLTDFESPSDLSDTVCR